MLISLMRVAKPSPIMDKNCTLMGPEILFGTGAGVWRKVSKAFQNSNSERNSEFLSFSVFTTPHIYYAVNHFVRRELPGKPRKMMSARGGRHLKSLRDSKLTTHFCMGGCFGFCTGYTSVCDLSNKQWLSCSSSSADPVDMIFWVWRHIEVDDLKQLVKKPCLSDMQSWKSSPQKHPKGFSVSRVVAKLSSDTKLVGK